MVLILFSFRSTLLNMQQNGQQPQLAIPFHVEGSRIALHTNSTPIARIDLCNGLLYLLSHILSIKTVS